MKWLWDNTTKVGFGQGVVNEHLKDFLAKKSKVLCIFGGGSIDKNGARSDVNKALTDLECDFKWTGGIEPSPDYDTCMRIISEAREFKPDLLLAVGGGSVIDATKFISLAACLDPSIDPWNLLTKKVDPSKALRIGTVLTLPATGSEWDSGFAISRRRTYEKLALLTPLVFPSFSLLDAKYELTLPARQIRNGLYDAMTHCIDKFLTGQVMPMNDNFVMSVMRELVDISKNIFEQSPNLELYERLTVAASFALNGSLTLGKEICLAIHAIGNELTVEYGIDHGATLAMITTPFLRHFKKTRGYLMARCAERVFDVTEGSDEKKADAFIEKLEKWILELGHVMTVSEWTGKPVNPGDLEVLTKLVMGAFDGKPFGWHEEVTEEIVREVLSHAIK